MKMVELFSTPSSVNIEISEDEFFRLENIMLFRLTTHQFDADKHAFIESPTEKDTKSTLWSTELGNAIHTVLKHASIANEHFHGQDVRSRVLALY